VIELSHEVAEGAPFIPGLQPPYGIRMHLTSGPSEQMFARDMGATNGIGVNLEQVEMTMHVSTHVDAIGHISIGGTLYNGVAASEGVSDEGLRHGGIETAPPFIARAILIDVAAYKEVDRLAPGYAVQPADLEAALRAQGVSIPEGSVVLKSLRIRENECRGRAGMLPGPELGRSTRHHGDVLLSLHLVADDAAPDGAAGVESIELLPRGGVEHEKIAGELTRENQTAGGRRHCRNHGQR
jgi:hypothetical protein